MDIEMQTAREIGRLYGLLDEGQATIARLKEALRVAVKEADGWYDECRGGEIPGEEMGKVRALIA